VCLCDLEIVSVYAPAILVERPPLTLVSGRHSLVANPHYAISAVCQESGDVEIWSCTPTHNVKMSVPETAISRQANRRTEMAFQFAHRP
jgi:hypothetical protein